MPAWNLKLKISSRAHVKRYKSISQNILPFINTIRMISERVSKKLP